MQCCFRLLQPERHVHLAVHRRRDGEVLLCLVAFAGLPIELAEAKVAVGDEGTHAKFQVNVDNASSSAFASPRSAVSKPSVNQL